MEKKIFFNILFSFQVHNDTFTMDENYIEPLRVVFKHSEIKLEDIEIPQILNMEELLIKI